MTNSILKICAVLLMCLTGCRTFHDRNNNKFRLWGLVSDNRNHIAQRDIDTIRPFRLDNFIAADIQHSGLIQHVNQKDIELLKNHYPGFVLIVWYPSCNSSRHVIQFAEQLDSAGVPYLLASLSYDLRTMQDYFRGATIRNKNMYIVPSGHQYSAKIVIKQNQLLSAVCPTC